MFITYSCVKKHQTLALYDNLCFLTVSVIQEFRCSCTGSSGSGLTHTWQPKLLSVLRASQVSLLGNEQFPSSVTWRLAGLSSSWAAGWRPPSVACHLSLSIGSSRCGSWLHQSRQASKQQISERAQSLAKSSLPCK